MHRLSIAIVAAASAVAFTQLAAAADVPKKAPLYKAAPVSVYNWGGWYVGGNVGYGWGTHSDPALTFTDPSGPNWGPYFAAGGNVTPNVRQKGVIGGLQLGYNWMLSPNWVAGLVTDLQASGMKASGTNTVQPVNFVLSNQTNSVETDWFGTVRAKLGVAQNNWLFYATGGLAYGQVKTSGIFNIPSFPATATGSNSTTRAGWAAGAGIDYGLTPNWTIGFEYLYIDFGHVSYTETGPASLGGATFTINNHVATNIARATLNYKF